MVIPIREGVKGLNEGLNEGLKSLLEAIQSNPGIKAKDLVAVKTGGYHVIPTVRTETGQKS